MGIEHVTRETIGEMSETLPMNFLGLEPRYSRYDRSRYVVWPIGYDATVSYRSGTREGPAAVIAASRQGELFDADINCQIHQAGVATLEPFEPNVSSPEVTLDTIFRQAKKIVSRGKFILALGGEHTISLPLIKAYAQRRENRDLSVLHIDAHLDMRDNYQGSKFSHACVMRRVHELGIATVSVGIRSVSHEEHRYVKGSHQRVFTAQQVHDDAARVIAEAIETLSGQVYLTIDLDGFDPAYAPGVGTPEPGGLDWFQVNRLITEIARTRRIVAADIVETLPIPGQVISEVLAARLAAKIIAVTQMAEKGSQRGKR